MSQNETSNSETSHNAYLAAGNATTTREKLAELACSIETRIRLRVAENPSCPTMALAALAGDKSAEVRCTVAAHPKATFAMLRTLAKDFSLSVRFALAEDPTLPRPILKMLGRDENPYISDRAKQTLERIKEEKSQKRRATNMQRKLATN